MLSILVDSITPRLTYVFDFTFKSNGVDYQLIENVEEYMNILGSKCNYSHHEPKEGFQFDSSNILFETTIEQKKLGTFKLGNQQCLQINGINDPFGAIFYTLSRYEEYLPFEADLHGRFQYKNSILSQFNWIDKAMCDRWIVEIFHILQLEKPTTTTKTIPSFDIDNAYAYKNKGVKRTFLSKTKDVLKRNAERIQERKKVFAGETEDPYDSFDSILTIAKTFPDTKLFWLNKSTKRYDRNISLKNNAARELLKTLDKSLEVGIHPSYFSNSNFSSLNEEKKELEEILNRRLKSSRQHFLKLSFPETYTQLLKEGIETDYTLGFADMYGFRSGTARPHYWYNLAKEQKTNLMLQPFVYMDGTFNDYLHTNIEDSKKIVQQLFNEVKEYGGNFVFIWHNETITDYQRWQGWSELLHFTLALENE